MPLNPGTLPNGTWQNSRSGGGDSRAGQVLPLIITDELLRRLCPLNPDSQGKALSQEGLQKLPVFCCYFVESNQLRSQKYRRPLGSWLGSENPKLAEEAQEQEWDDWDVGPAAASNQLLSLSSYPVSVFYFSYHIAVLIFNLLISWKCEDQMR